MIDLPLDPTDEELARDWTLTAADLAQVRRCRGDNKRHSFALQLCVLRQHGLFLGDDYSKVPVRIINHIGRQLGLPPMLFAAPPSRAATDVEHERRIREHLGYRTYDDAAHQVLEMRLRERAAQGLLANELLAHAAEFLRENRRSTSNVWYASFYDANGNRQTRSTRQLDKRAAAATLREWERRAADPTYAASHQTTLEEALRGVLRDRKLKGRAEGTLDCYRVKAGHLTRILGEQLRLREVTARSVDAFIDRRLNEGAARNTIHKELTVLRSALKVSKRRGEFAGDIAA
jgi:hypothetical protein